MYQLVDGIWQELETEQRTESHVYIDGNLLQDYGIDVEITSQEPINPPIFNRTLSIPGMPGAWDFGGELEPRMIVLDCVFPHQSYSDLKKQIREFNKLLFDEYGKPKEVKLVFGDEMDVFINARVSAGIDVDRTYKRGLASVEFVAHDPFKYSNVFSDEIVWGSEEITFEWDLPFGHEGFPGTLRIQEDSTIFISVTGIAIQPIIEINGQADNLIIEANGHEIKFDNFKGSDFIIDIEHYSVIKDGKETLRGVEFREFLLMPGNNEIKVSGRNMDISFFIRHRDKFN